MNTDDNSLSMSSIEEDGREAYEAWHAAEREQIEFEQRDLAEEAHNQRLLDDPDEQYGATAPAPRTHTRIQTTNQFVATFIGRGEFYSGIANGERVLLTVETTVYWYVDPENPQVTPTKSSSHLSVQKIDGKSAHLSVSLDEIADVTPMLESPKPELHYNDANGYWVADASDLGLSPGEWPTTIDVVCGDQLVTGAVGSGSFDRNAEGELLCVYYRAPGYAIRIYND